MSPVAKVAARPAQAAPTELELLRGAVVKLGTQVGQLVAGQAELAAAIALVARQQVELVDRSAEVLGKLDLVLDSVRATQAHVDQLRAEVMALQEGR